MRHNAVIEYAETLVSPQYTAASNAAFEASPDHYTDQRIAAQDVIFNAIRAKHNANERAWEMRRLAAIREVSGTDLGGFSAYIHDQGGEAPSADPSKENLTPPNPDTARINARILDSANLYEEPIDFLEDALDIINSRPAGTRHKRGPENYATAIKFFADKYEDFPSNHLSKTAIRDVVGQAIGGFLEVSKHDKPNFIELTNVYFAIRTLPRGSFDPKYSKDILLHSLEQLPSFDNRALSRMVAAIAKLDVSEVGEVAATAVDLAMRKSKKFETTMDMRYALRAIRQLPSGAATTRAFGTFMELRNNLEEPLDLDGADEINDHLLYIVQNVVDDPDLTYQAKQIAQVAARRAIRVFQHAQHLGDITGPRLEQLRATVARTVNNFKQI